ncbi:MAG TPA: thioredoxin [Bacteroidales bacterium]|nr:thioredoxin [Bacteroidales bacterium]
MAIEINDNNFNEIINKSFEKPLVIDLWAEWCGPCRMIAPIINELANEYEGKAIIGKVNVDNNPTITTKFAIRNIPTILFIKNGEVVDKQVGVAPKAVIESKIKTLL